MKAKDKIRLQNEIIDNLLDRIIALEKAERASYARLWESVIPDHRQHIRALEEKVERLSRNWED